MDRFHESSMILIQIIEKVALHFFISLQKLIFLLAIQNQQEI